MHASEMKVFELDLLLFGDGRSDIVISCFCPQLYLSMENFFLKTVLHDLHTNDDMVEITNRTTVIISQNQGKNHIP